MPNNEQIKYLNTYVRDIANRMLLHDYDIMVMSDPSDDDADAQVQVLAQRKIVNIRVCKNLETHSQSSIRETVVHELLHVCFGNAEHVIRTDLMRHSRLLDDEADFIYQIYMRQHELGIDCVAKFISEFFPLPNAGLVECVEEQSAQTQTNRSRSKKK